ncbi:MAG TPA: HigA family addiction module antitoxin [Acidobacteriota bacterium]|nr:HigA family addiction module antitoxin [Acidobacteriota bacterium]
MSVVSTTILWAEAGGKPGAVTRAALSRILNGTAGISADMALRLSDPLGTTPELWIGMQAQYDLWQASRKKRKKINRLQAA